MASWEIHGNPPKTDVYSWESHQGFPLHSLPEGRDAMAIPKGESKDHVQRIPCEIPSCELT